MDPAKLAKLQAQAAANRIGERQMHRRIVALPSDYILHLRLSQSLSRPWAAITRLTPRLSRRKGHGPSKGGQEGQTIGCPGR